MAGRMCLWAVCGAMVVTCGTKSDEAVGADSANTTVETTSTGAGTGTGTGTVPTSSVPEVYDLSQEQYVTDVIWTGTQGSASQNNFNGKNYHNMSVWRDGFTYLVYVDDQYFPRITRVSDEGTDVTTAKIADYEVLADGHHALAIGIDSDGYLHVSGDMHNFPGNNDAHLPSEYESGKCMYWRSTLPLNIDEFQWRGGGPDGDMPYGDSFSYMSFVSDHNGDLYYYARTRTNYLDGFGNKQVFTVSRYDGPTQTWHPVGPVDGDDRRSAVTLVGSVNENGSGSYTRIHGWVSFDRSNRMYMGANVIEAETNYATSPHYATHALYLQSDDQGRTATRVDGGSVVLPGHAEAGHAQQATVAWAEPGNALATYTSIAPDIELRPYMLLKHQERDAGGGLIGDSMRLLRWRIAEQEWENLGDLDGRIRTGMDSRIYSDSFGVMTVVVNGELIRFYDPDDLVVVAPVNVNLENVDHTYLMATGDIQALVPAGDDIQLVRVTIQRPTL